LLAQTAVNASFGGLVGSGLWFIGVPNPGLWGILGMLLRFIPYIGPIIAAALPMIVALAVDPGWSMLLWTTGLFVVVELTAGQAIEPWLYGHSTGLSGIAVIAAAAFWTLLWGPIGLLLSTPLTMCLVVLGRHVEHLQFLEVLLGDQPDWRRRKAFISVFLPTTPRIWSKSSLRNTHCRPITTKLRSAAWHWRSWTSTGVRSIMIIG
jgi:predicted PurR-regulated permease PerM